MNGNLKMNNTISSCFMQAFTGMPFPLSIGGILLVLGIGGLSDIWSAMENYKNGLLDYGIHFTILETTLRSDAMCLLMPVFCTIPFTASFLEDLGYGFIKSYLPRAGRGHYIAGKILVAAISGGCVPAIGIGIYYNLLRLLLLPMEKAGVMEMTSLVYGKDVGKTCVLFFCAGMLFSLVGMVFSVVTTSKHMAYASPFVFEYTLIILHERYWKDMFVFYPKEWFHPSEQKWMMGKLGVVIFLLMLCSLMVACLIPIMHRRMSEI